MAHVSSDGRSITASGLTRLLARLHPDAEQAAQEYERLRRTLVKFFDWRGALTPDECADETIDRLARRLEHTIVEDLRHYAQGIARLVLLERRRGPLFSPLDETPEMTSAATPPGDENVDRLHDCFDRCLAGIPEESRSLLLRYYEGEKRSKILNRRSIASALGVSDSALRNRVQRLRDRLEQCVEACTAPAAEVTSS
jgi:DNA-directed RNA polymerase specialized sigma24 family protein